MRNIKLLIEYDGTNFVGWQVQKNQKSKIKNQKLRTVQGTIEELLSKILQEKVKVIGAGRTDSGVHALGQVANFKTHSGIDLKNLQRGLNSLLPENVNIQEVEEVNLNFHARFHARGKFYRYSILNSPVRPVFLRDYFWHIPYSLDLKLMQEEARGLLGRHDFLSFCASGSKVKDTVRTVKELSLKRVRLFPGCLKSCKAIILDIKADGFLYNMVRNIVGTLVEIGREKIPKGALEKILKQKDRRLAGPTAPARGLCLMEVEY